MRFRLRVLLLAITVGFGWFEFRSANAEGESSSEARFVERTDEQAARDLAELRYALSRARDSRGNIDPLADYAVPAENAIEPLQVPKPQEKNNRIAESSGNPPTSRRIADDPDAKQVPRLSQSQGASYQTPKISWQTCIDVSGTPRPAGLTSGTQSVSSISPRRAWDGTRSSATKYDQDSEVRPSLDEDVVYASANLSVDAGSLDRISRFQEIPYGSQGTPVIPMPNLGGSTPNYPSSPAPIYPPNTGVYPPANTPIYPPSAPVSPVYPPVTSVPQTQTIPVLPPTSPVTPIYPTQPVVVQPPPPYYPPVTSPVPSPTLTVPIASAPSSPLSTVSEPTRYSAESSIVNYKPFVSAAPRQVDARYMVSPSVFRPAVASNCNSCASGTPYAPMTNSTVPGGGPFTYAPPTYMPYPTANDGRYPNYRSLIGFGQDVSSARVGRGIIGQPTAYMPSQPFRNILRYIFP